MPRATVPDTANMHYRPFDTEALRLQDTFW